MRAVRSPPSREADRPYYGVDYQERARDTPGADRLDFYRNIPVPTSYMVVDTDHEFFGGFDHAVGAGFVHWADRRVAPGKKQWTWGNAPFGQAWDRLLTDSDGPYVELMAGVYTDNQPDFSWLAPGESKRFSQYWYPIPAIGVAHEASPDAAIHVERGSEFSAAVAVTSPQPAARLLVLSPTGEQLVERSADLVPGVPWQRGVPGLVRGRDDREARERRAGRRSSSGGRPSRSTGLRSRGPRPRRPRPQTWRASTSSSTSASTSCSTVTRAARRFRTGPRRSAGIPPIRAC